MPPSVSPAEPAVSVSRVLELLPSATLPRFAAAGVSVAGVSARPVPVSVAVSGLPPLRVTVRTALRTPAFAGLKVTSILQLPDASRVGQSSLAANSLEPVSTVPIASPAEPAVSVNRVLEPLPRSTVWKSYELGANVGWTTARPAPCKTTMLRRPEALRTVRPAVRSPAALGTNLTRTRQTAPAGSSP
jgi:hypothetical protein